MIRYTPDANFVLKKWSTWLSILAASMFSGVMAYDHLPRSVLAAMPEWAGTAMGITAVLSAMLIPIATSIQQRSIPTVDPTQASYRQTYYGGGYDDYHQTPDDEEMP